MENPKSDASIISPQQTPGATPRCPLPPMPSLSSLFSPSRKQSHTDVPNSTRRSPSDSPARSPSSSPIKGPHHNSKPSFSVSSTSNRSKRNSRTRSAYDNIHPLNLPPAERERRLSAMSDAAGSMNFLPFEEPQSSGQNGNSEPQYINGEKSPTPPPHKSSVPAAKPSVNPEECKALGNKYFKAKDFDKAIAEYTKALSVEPSSVTYLSNRAAAYMSDHRYEDALEDSKAASRIEPENTKVMHRTARILTSLGRPTEAMSVYENIASYVEVTPQEKAPAFSMETHIRQAEKAIQEGTAGSMAIHALDQAERGLGLGVERPRRWQLIRGEAYLKMGSVNALGQAQDVALTLLRKNQKDPEALVLRGRVFYSQGDNAKALQHFRQALNCDPDLKDGLKYLRLVQKLDRMKEEGNTLYKSGQNQQAIEAYTRALEVDPSCKLTNSKIVHNRALAFNKLKEYKSAIADCDRALTLDPSFSKARKTRATALGESGDWEESVREWKAIKESSPEEADVNKNLRHAELELKKSKRKDLYKILSVEKDASDNDIKRAYRKLAIVHHPDKNPGDETAAERFKDVGEAYETLSDPQKRSRYDRGEDLIDPSEMFAQQGGMGGFPMGGGMGGVQIDPEMLFNMMGSGGGGGGFTFSTGAGGMPFGGGPSSGGGRRRGGGAGFSGFPGL